MRYDGYFLVDIDGTRVAKNAKVSLNCVYDADRNETFQLSITTLITKAEYQALVRANMNRRNNESVSTK